LPELEYVSDDDLAMPLFRYERWESSKEGERPAVIRDALQRVMQEDFGVFRTGEVMEQGLKRLDALRERLKHAYLADKTRVFNTERVAALELDNLMATAYATAKSAMARTESRGAHSREDYPKRDDQNWIKHTIYIADDDKIDYRPVNMSPQWVDSLPPKERVY
jgi:succinate dehydrogenase / fumarate reductase, flavoprotein subunit